MSIPNTTEFSKITEEIREYVASYVVQTSTSTKLLLEFLENKQDLMVKEIGLVVEKLDKTAKTHTQLENEVKELEAKKKEFFEREATIIGDEEQIKKERQELLELHQALENKRNVIEEREAKLKEKERRQG